MPIPVVSVAQMREWEAATWATGQTEAEVIRRVGTVLASRLLCLTRPGDRILVLAGKGHNGDDARAAFQAVSNEPTGDYQRWQERLVQVLNVTDPSADLPRLRRALADGPAWIVDALFGIGLNRPLSQDWIQFIDTINSTAECILAVDVPSGLNAENGQHFGTSIVADVTLTVGAPKLGMIKPEAADYVGKLEVAADVGLDARWLAGISSTAELSCTTGGEFRAFPPRRKRNTHKGSYGHLAILAGSSGFHGAAVLATRGAQRAQPGLITLFAHGPAYLPIAAQTQAVMVSGWRVPPKLPASYDAVLVGPGLAAPEVRDAISQATRHLWCSAECPVVVDASALDWVPLEAPARNAIRILTPHPGEAARMLRSTVPRVEADRPAAVRNLSRRYGNAWVILKGHQTLVGRSTGPILLNTSGNPQLAQGGSGDLLAGFIAGLVAQRALREDVLTLLAYAVWQHGAAADRLQTRRRGWTIEELSVELG